MSSFLIWVCLVIGYLLASIAEGRRHRVNYRFLIGRGAEETAQGLMRCYYAAPWVIFSLAATERYFHVGGALPEGSRLIALTLIILGFLLRIWVIHTLGWLWTMRCLHRGGFPRVSSGPFRWMAHPEYVGRLIEAAGFCLFLNSYYTLSLCLASGIIAIVCMTQRELVQMRDFQAACPGDRDSG